MPPVEISIIVPCRNEAENVIELAERARVMFEAHGIEGEVIFVNDGSTDHTGALIDDLAARCPFVRAVHHPQNRGIPAGWESGLNATTGRHVAIMDGDLQYLPEDIYRLYRQLKHTNADVVQGWRSHIGRPHDFRYLMSRVLHHMLRLLFGVRLFDIKSGFLICDREVFAHILRRRFSYYYFQTFIVVSAHHKGYRIEEIESLFEERKLGESFISAFPLKMILKNLADVAKGFVEFRLLSVRTDVLSDFLGRYPVSRRPEPLSVPRRLYLRCFAALMPLHHWKLSSTALRYYYQLRRTQWLRPEEIRALQEARLRALIKHAYRHVPYYRERFDRLQIDADKIQRIEDLQDLPVLTKNDIRRNLHFDLMSDSHNKLQMLPVTTSGASGEPLTLYVDKMQLEMRWATTLRNQEWTGYRFGDRIVRLGRLTHGTSRLQALREKVDSFLARRTSVPALRMNPESLDRCVELVRQRRPALLDGDAEKFDLIANHLRYQRAEGLHSNGLVSSRQTLSPESRARIEQAFGTQVFDEYGSQELGGIAHECEKHQGYHLNAESYVVEIVRDGRPAQPGETGDVLITDLTNLSVPLIRYAIGDRAAVLDSHCSCGRGLPLIGPIQGRVPSIIVGTDGCFVPGTFFADVLKDHGHIIRQFRIVQERRGAIDLRIVKGPRFSQAALEKVLKLILQHLGNGLIIEVHFVDELAAGASHSISNLVIDADLFVSTSDPSP